MILVSKAGIKKYVEQHPEYGDYPPYIFVEVLPCLRKKR
jgi:hypothetical protein